MASPGVLAVLRGQRDFFPGATFGADFRAGRYRLGRRQYRHPSAIPGWSFTRASTGYAETSGGVLVPFASGAPRITDKGLLVEGARTNLLLNSAVLATQDVTVSAVAHTLSFRGTGTVTLSGVSTAGPLVGTGVNDRVTLTFTPTAGTLTLTVSGSVTYANLEAGSFATSYIPTAGASATRAADVPAIGGLAGTWPYTVVAEWAREGGTDAATFYRVMATSLAGVSSTAIYQRHTTNVVRAFVSGTADAGSGVAVIGAVTKAATRFEANNVGISLNGAAAETDVTVTPLLYDKIHLGTDEVGARQLDGYLRRLAIYPYAMTDAQLRAAPTW